MDMGSIQADVYQWASEKIVGCTWRGITKHMEHEIVELNAELATLDELEANSSVWSDTHERVAKELSDIVILSMHLAGKMGIDLERHVTEKMVVNKKRTWSKPDAEGVIHHI